MMLDSVHFYTGQVINDYIYASQSFFNGLIRVDIRTGKVKYLSVFPDEKLISPVLHRFSFLYKNKIFFIPCDAKNVAVYSVDRDVISHIPINQLSFNIDNKKNYFINNNELWLVPVSGEGDVIIVNMDNNETKICTYDENPFAGATILNMIQDGDRVVFGKCNSNILVEYNVKNRTISSTNIPEIKIQTVSKGTHGVWIINEEGHLFIEMKDDKGIEVFSRDGDMQEMYVNVIDTENGTYAIPYNLGEILVKEPGDNSFRKIANPLFSLRKTFERFSAFSYDLLETNEMWLVPPHNTNKMLVIDKMSGDINAIELEFEDTVLFKNDDIYSEIIGSCCSENQPLDLETFISVI